MQDATPNTQSQAEQPPYRTLKPATVAAIIAGILIVAFLCFAQWPLDNEKAIHKAATEAHNALQNLSIYDGVKRDCDSHCPVCHPFTWRMAIRLDSHP